MWNRSNSQIVDGMILSPGALERAQFLMLDCSDDQPVDDRTRVAWATLRADRLQASDRCQEGGRHDHV